ncbi:hypothetical protein WKW80_36720 [Variovorax humicola]|uniref:Uncharacterized protein n=1 Tax=Variovorax humicola TaxID=1769758 RepID=A0ABU8WBW9_9BURK
MKNLCFLKLSVGVAVFAALQTPHLVVAQQAPPGPIDQTFVINPGDAPYACNFPLQGHIQGKTGTLTLPGPRFITLTTSPNQNVTLTNLNTKETVTLNITGTTKFHEDQSFNKVYVVNGRNLLGDPVAGLVLGIGNFNFIFDQGGNLITPLNGTGRLLPVCPMLE